MPNTTTRPKPVIQTFPPEPDATPSNGLASMSTSYSTKPLVQISRDSLQLAYRGLERIAAKFNRELEYVAAALRSGDDPIHITEEALRTARQGLEMEAAELAGYLSDVTATLEPPSRRHITKNAERIESGELVGYTYKMMPGWTTKRKVWDNDPEGKYRHAPNGEIRLQFDGSPWRRPQYSPELKAKLAAAHAREFRHIKPTKSAPISKSVKVPPAPVTASHLTFHPEEKGRKKVGRPFGSRNKH